MEKTIGILGGMGPLATADLFRKITLLTDAARDNDHIRVYIDSNARIPDRTAAILGTAEEQEGIINATSTEAIPDLLRAAAAEGADRLVVRVSYLSTDRAGVEQMVRDVQEEKDGGRDAGMLAAPWQVSFYPDTDEPGIVEILLK